MHHPAGIARAKLMLRELRPCVAGEIVLSGVPAAYVAYVAGESVLSGVPAAYELAMFREFAYRDIRL